MTNMQRLVMDVELFRKTQISLESMIWAMLVFYSLPLSVCGSVC